VSALEVSVVGVAVEDDVHRILSSGSSRRLEPRYGKISGDSPCTVAWIGE